MSVLVFFRKSYVKAHQRRLKSGQVITIPAHYDQRTKKGADAPLAHDHDLRHLDAAKRATFEKMHAEQHLLHHYHAHALRQRVQEQAAHLEGLAKQVADHRAAGRHVEAAKTENQRLRLYSRHRVNQRELDDIEQRLAGLAGMKEALVQGSGAIDASTADSHNAYAAKLGERFKAKPGTPQANLQRGHQAMARVIADHADVPAAMYCQGRGWVSFYWGTPGKSDKGFAGGSGIAKIIAKRTAEGADGEAVARKMVEVIGLGQPGEIYGPVGGERFNIQHDGHTAVLSLRHFGKEETWLLTGWDDHETASGGGEAGNASTTYTRQPSGMRADAGAEPKQSIDERGARGKPLLSPFTPTHELPDGTPVRATGEKGVYTDASGAEIEDDYAKPMKAAAPKPLVVVTKPAAPQPPAVKPAETAKAPQEGDTKSENGIDYVLKNGRWHRTTKTPTKTKTKPNPTHYRVNITSPFGEFQVYVAADKDAIPSDYLKDAKTAFLHDSGGGTGFTSSAQVKVVGDPVPVTAVPAEASAAKNAEWARIAKVVKPEQVEETGLRYDPATNRHSGQKLVRGDVLQGADGKRYTLDRDMGFSLQVDALGPDGRIVPASTRTISVDPSDRDRFLEVSLTGENLFDAQEVKTPVVPDQAPIPEAPADDLDPSSPNYRYRDTGYVGGSRKVIVFGTSQGRKAA